MNIVLKQTRARLDLASRGRNSNRPGILRRTLPIGNDLRETTPSLRRLMSGIARDVSLLLDSINEAESNAERGEEHFLRINLMGCLDLGRRIERRRKRARRVLAKVEGI